MSIVINKGHIAEDKTYVYTCHRCNFTDDLCPYCFARNMELVRVNLRHTRGQQYYALLKTALSVIGKDICDSAASLGNQHGKLTWMDLGYLTVQFDIPFKPLVEWLEETGVVKSGTYRYFQENGGKVGVLLDKARIAYDDASATQEAQS